MPFVFGRSQPTAPAHNPPPKCKEHSSMNAADFAASEIGFISIKDMTHPNVDEI